MPWYDGKFRKLPWVGDSISSAAPPFYMATLPDPLVIYDAIASPFTDAGAGLVSQWNDLSGNSNHAIQGTTASQPTFGATGWDGSLPALDFGANPIRLDFTSPLAISAKTLYACFKLNNGATGHALAGHFGGDGGLIFYGGTRLEWFENGFVDFSFNYSTIKHQLTFATDNVAIGSGGVFKSRADGSALSFAGGSNGINVVFNNIGFAENAAGAYDSMRGTIAFLGIYGSLHSDANIAAAESFLQARFPL